MKINYKYFRICNEHVLTDSLWHLMNRFPVLMISKYTSVILLLFCLLSSCEEKSYGPVGADTAIAPGQVTQVKVESSAGAVKLTYNLPNDKNLLYVKAQVTINGVVRETRASFYQNFLEIKGFGDTTEYSVAICAVNRGEKASEPVYVNVKPLLPPILETYESLDLFAVFGGASVSFNNPSEGELSIVVLIADSIGDWQLVDIYYTKKPLGNFSVRGYEPEKRKFAVYIQDRWNNRSDTLIKELTPFFEQQLDRRKFTEYVLPTDEPSAWGWVMPYIWDGIIVNNSNVDKPGFHTTSGRWPQHFTFNLGVKAKLSRFRFWQRGSWVSFSDRNLKKFEIWGSNSPAADGSFNGWTKLLEGESIKPSGLPMGTNSNEDLELIGAGEEFIFPMDAPSVKFIRIKVLETWSGADSFYIMQVAFWGAEE